MILDPHDVLGQPSSDLDPYVVQVPNLEQLEILEHVLLGCQLTGITVFLVGAVSHVDKEFRAGVEQAFSLGRGSKLVGIPHEELGEHHQFQQLGDQGLQLRRPRGKRRDNFIFEAIQRNFDELQHIIVDF